MFNPQRILILAPHTDDGELGCGGTIARFCSNKKEVHYAAFSDCKRSLPAGSAPDTLEKECKKAIHALGMHPSKLLLYDFEVREFTQKRQEILQEMISLNKYIQPELVFIPCATDIHQDHQVIHNEALRAFKHSSIFGYELPWNQSRFNTTLFNKLTAEEVDKKVKALLCYQS
ncbi:MAG TPA: PIG-L family deacetylase, partial [Chitinophagaceae bacterium]|nr:PIG-L family deacetylase [Chitinophagaceae bacterium]